MFGGRSSLVRYSNRLINLHHRRSLCNKPTSINIKNPQNPDNNRVNGGDNEAKPGDHRHLEAYRDLDKLDFTKAAKILFSSHPPKKKEFGFDFHLVQLFFALMPSLAVYLVAKYSRYEMRRMEAELELKKKAEEEKKAKEIIAAVTDEKEPEPDSELLKVKERLEALEEVIKDIAVETKKRSSDYKSKSSDSNSKSNEASMQPLKQEDSEKNESETK